MDNQTQQIRGVLISLQAGKILLPNTTVSEIITFITPEAVENKPNWYIGALRWKGYRLPLVSYSLMTGDQQETLIGAKVAILKALSGDLKMPYYAVLTQGFPRLVNIANDQLLDNKEHSDEFFYSAYLNDEIVRVPKLERIEEIIRENL
ncbi:MAG TPA: chemotaxis protein CheW [Arenimonas sp.]|nr:chemotaxis protein CheW [Arenimonas sp.]